MSDLESIGSAQDEPTLAAAYASAMAEAEQRGQATGFGPLRRTFLERRAELASAGVEEEEEEVEQELEIPKRVRRPPKRLKKSSNWWLWFPLGYAAWRLIRYLFLDGS